ncbi:MAG: Cna B-type domain-containing protein [Ruminococcus sp.]|nr:Cna B-type domain-containing protein [Ruminococcus sp.]
MQEAKKRSNILIVILVCTLSLLCLSVKWKVNADENEKSITLTCVRGDDIIEGMRWRLYRVGERQGGDFVLTGDFSAYPVDLKDMSVENVMAAAQTLTSYAVADHIPVLAEGYTDADGKLTFGSLDTGLYMAVGTKMTIGAYTYEPSPLLLEVTSGNAEFNFDAYPKIVRATLASVATSHTVKKVWLDYDDLFEARPVYVTVDLFRNDELYDTVTLNEENNWEYKWLDLDAHYEWRVVERQIPVDYELRIEYNETQYLIRNRHKIITDWGEVTRTTTLPPTVTGTGVTTSYTTTASQTESTSQPTTTSNDVGGGQITESTASTTAIATNAETTTTTAPVQTTTVQTGGGKGKLPQTGQLWWPVFPLGLGGTLMLFTGAAIKPKKDENEEQDT